MSPLWQDKQLCGPGQSLQLPVDLGVWGLRSVCPQQDLLNCPGVYNQYSRQVAELKESYQEKDHAYHAYQRALERDYVPLDEFIAEQEKVEVLDTDFRSALCFTCAWYSSIVTGDLLHLQLINVSYNVTEREARTPLRDKSARSHYWGLVVDTGVYTWFPLATGRSF
ncbi:hypothetical protein J4Q44_G00365950 [Coregonus suidteri]|uniref:Uncharacterized protein n=1 Tax=Coregonus suidteri TaxID=861788 RepID=A0AAN8KDT6_9TELE